MNKLVAVILFALLSIAYAEVKEDHYGLMRHGHLADHTDDYITLNLLQYKRILDRYDAELHDYEDSYSGRLGTINTNLDFVIKSVVKTNERLDPLLVLSDFSKKCVLKYRYDIPTIEVTKTAITKCREDYSKQLNVLLKAAVSARNVLSGYITNYNHEVENCGSHFGKSAANYTLCVATVTDKTNNLVNSNEKHFQVQMEAADCTAKAYIKSAIDCSYSVQVRTHTLLAEAEVLINKCLIGEDECKPCEDYTCTESFDLHEHVHNKTIHNPFYGRPDSPKCIMLSV